MLPRIMLHLLMVMVMGRKCFLSNRHSFLEKQYLIFVLQILCQSIASKSIMFYGTRYVGVDCIFSGGNLLYVTVCTSHSLFACKRNRASFVSVKFC